jgi:hemolysin III
LPLYKSIAVRFGSNQVFDWNYDRAEIVADGVVHALGVALGLTGTIALVIFASRANHGGALSSSLAYAMSLMAMLALSAAYNLWPVGAAKWLLRRLDHSAIFLLIAGTYTPFMALCEGGALPKALLIVIWLTAAAGTAIKIGLPGRLDGFSIALYLLLGWSIVIVYPIFALLPSACRWLLGIGGALYTIGVIFHVWQRLRFQNAIWHGFVLLAAACHYAAVMDFISTLMP